MNNLDNSPATERTPRHSIGAVARRTGLSIHVLRAWERRYGAVSPGRTAGRQRLYADADITRLRLLRRITESGRPIGQVAHLTTSELLSLVGADGGGSEVGGEVGEAGDLAEEEDESAVAVGRCLEAGERLEGERVQAELRRAALRLGAAQFVEGVAAPLLVEAGERWHAGRWQVAQEHVVSTAVRRVVSWLLDTVEEGGGPVVVVGTASGERHELGAMLAAVVAAGEGWRVVYAGPDLPAADLALLAGTRRAVAVALSVIYVERRSRLLAEVAELRQSLGAGTPLLVGGKAAAGALARDLREAGASVLLGDMAALRVVLRALAGRGTTAGAAA